MRSYTRALFEFGSQCYSTDDIRLCYMNWKLLSMLMKCRKAYTLYTTFSLLFICAPALSPTFAVGLTSRCLSEDSWNTLNFNVWQVLVLDLTGRFALNNKHYASIGLNNILFQFPNRGNPLKKRGSWDSKVDYTSIHVFYHMHIK